MAQIHFEQLLVYQLAETLSDEIWKIVTCWSIFAKDTMGKQLVRAADSVGANIAEGCGRFSFPEKRRFAHIARGSLQETQHWLRRAFQRKILTPDQVALLKPIMDRLAPLLNGFIRSIKKADVSGE
jgi:four helix bundle protein